jgi:hypothetical protein
MQVVIFSQLCGRFHKHFTSVIYGPRKTSYTVRTCCYEMFSKHTSLFHYGCKLRARKMFMKSTPVFNVIKLFTAVSYDFT